MAEVPVLVASSCEVAVMVAVPTLRSLTRPRTSTVATALFELDHVTFLPVAPAGAMVAVSCTVEPTAPDEVAGPTVTPVTATRTYFWAYAAQAVKNVASWAAWPVEPV